MKNQYLDAGKIVNTHGIRGEIKVFPLCDGPEFLLEFDRFFINGEEIEVISSRVHKNVALIRLSGIDHIEQAEQLVGNILQINCDDIELEEGRYFIEDLVGMKVVDVDTGKEYGTLKSVIQTGANDVYEVQGDKLYLIPKIDEVVLNTDMDAGIISIRPLKGLFDE